MGKINEDIRLKINQIIDEQNAVLLRRRDVINGLWVAAISNLHLVMLGPGGTGKSMSARNMFSHITGAKTFETALDETTEPSRVFGSVDVKAMVEEGKTLTVTTGMFPEADIAFVDEIMNANPPVKHSLQPGMNERLFHNPTPVPIPLRFLIAGTNVNNADTDPALAPFFDRLHLRYTVGYLRDREDQSSMIAQGIARIATQGRGLSAGQAATHTTVSLAEMDQAHAESLNLDVNDEVMEKFLDLREELAGEGILFSDRRMVDGMAAVLAQAWLRGHDEVQSGDLDILTAMWWSLQETESKAHDVILQATNPAEKAAKDLFADLDKLQADLRDASDTGIDDSRMQRLGIELVKNTDRALNQAKEALSEAVALGANTDKLEDAIRRASKFKVEVGRVVFGVDEDELADMTNS